MSRRILIVTALSLVCAAGAALGAPPETRFVQKAREVAGAHKDSVTLTSIGASREGADLVLLRLASLGEVKPEERPALLIVAGLDGRHLVGCDAAVGLADRLASEHADLLKKCTVYIIPAANPDALAWTLDGGHPKTDYGRTIAPFDADRDGRLEEDPGEDLDGDGAILTMRVKNPPPGSGLRAEYMIDADHPKVLKKTDATKGERAEYALLVEGSDKDGDGKRSEDGIGGTGGGGVDLNMNFPYRWPESTDGAGMYQLCEPESLALVKWMLATPNIVAVLSYGPSDTIINIPEAGKFDPTNQVPLGIENGDKPYWEEVSKLYKDATKQTGAPTSELAGSFHGWAYAVYGAYAFSTPVWVRPDLVKKEETPKGEAPDEKKEESKPEGAGGEAGASAPQAATGPTGATGATGPTGQPPVGGGRGGGRRGGGQGGPGGRGPGGGGTGSSSGRRPGEPTGDDAKWLKYSDDQAAAGGKAGFVDWHAFKHPQLGEVEIGGFLPGFKHNPPESETDRLVGEQTKFIAALLVKFPDVHAEAPVVEKLGPGVWRITIRVINDGFLPSAAEIENKARRGTPTLATIDVPLDRLIAGEKHNRAWVIPGSGGRVEYQWTVKGSDGDKVPFKVRPHFGAPRTVDVELKEASR